MTMIVNNATANTQVVNPQNYNNAQMNPAINNQNAPVMVADARMLQNVPNGNPAVGLNLIPPPLPTATAPVQQEQPNWGLMIGIGAAAVLTSPLWLPLVGGIFSGAGALFSGIGGVATSAAPHIGTAIVTNAGSIAAGVIGGVVGYGVGQAIQPPRQ